MWKYCCAFWCTLGTLVLCTPSLLATIEDPSLLPLVQFADVIYAGAFRLPDQFVNGDGFTQGGHPVAYNPERDSLFIGSRLGRIAEVTIPTPVNSPTITSLPFASFVQGFVDPTEGNMWQIANDGAGIDGILVHGNRLYGTASIYYDAQNTQRLSHYSRSTNLSTPSFVGMSQVWDSAMSGFVSGFMANVPAEWQAKLGGPAITGQCCLPIAYRTSWGPSAFAWNPAHVGAVNPVPASPLLYYPGGHPTLGHWESSNPVFGGTTQINGVAVIAGTRTALYFGRNGTGPFCYGNGTGNQSLVGTIGPDHEIFCFDPSNPAKGQHAYPYHYQIWAYDLNDLAAVKAGTKQPWEVVPYGVWPFTLPTPEATVRIGGIGYDATRQMIYVSQMLADQDGYGYRPIVHALRIGTAPGAPAPAAALGPPPPPPPAPATKVSVMAISANKTAPQPPGTTVTFTAAPTGGVAPLQFKWWTFDGSWLPVGGWTTSSTFTWTPATTYPFGRVTVWARSAGSTVEEAEASTAMDFVIAGTAVVPPAPTADPVPAPAPAPGTSLANSLVTITANKVAPQPPLTTITFTAATTGGIAPLQYKWWIYEEGWKAIGTWTTSNTFAWTPNAVNPGGRITVWVRNSGATADEAQNKAAMDFVIAAGTGVTAPAARVSAVTLGANKIAPQPAGSPVTFTALPTGGAAPYQYKWWIFEDGWKAMGGWTTAQTFTWTPTAANANGRVTVWVRSAGSTADEAQAQAAMEFVINAATVTAPVVTAPVATGSPYISAVALSANRVAPQPAGTAVTFTAVPTGGIAPQQYKWWIYQDGWLAIGDWTTSNTFTWTPTAANPNGRITVWVRSAGNTADEAQARNAIDFIIK